MIKDEAAVTASGLVADHVRKFQEIAKNENTFLLFRPVNPMSTSLIASGFGTKGLDIHSKSSDWGPQAGFICVDQTLSKKWGVEKSITQGERDARHSINPKDSAVIEMPLMITEDRHQELQKQGLYSSSANGQVLTLTGTKGDPAYKMTLWPAAKLDGLPDDTKAALAPHQGKILNMKGKISALSSGYLVLYERTSSKKIDGLSYAAAAARPANAASLRPVMVLGYASSGVPVTADYDMFAICPSLSLFRAAFNWGRVVAKVTNKSHSNWSGLIKAAQTSLGQVERRDVDANMGRLTAFQRKIKDLMNSVVNSPGGNVVHHGTEQDNTQFPEKDDCILVLSPGGQISGTTNWQEVQNTCQDIIRLGYVFYQNRAYNAEAGSKVYYPGQAKGGASNNANYKWEPEQGAELMALDKSHAL